MKSSIDRTRVLRVAVVGCGNIAHAHIPAITRLKQARIVCVCDRDETRAESVARQYGIDQAFSSFQQALEQAKPEVVHVLTPPQTHAELTIQSLQAGCHVLVEKPLSLSAAEAESIYSAAQRAGRVVSVDHTYMWDPLVKRAKKVVESGRLGRILHIQYVMCDDYLDAVKAGSPRWPMELQGGAFSDLIPHPLYVIHSFLPDAQVVSARACGTDMHDLRELWVDFAAEGAGAGLWMSLNARPLEHALRVFCTQGIVHIDLRNYSMAVVPDRGLPGPAARVINVISESSQRGMGTLGTAFALVAGRFNPKEGTAGAIREFYQAILEGKPAPVAPAEAQAPVEMAAAIWDALENSPGALRPAVDKKGHIVKRKTLAEFPGTKSGLGDKSPRVLVTGGTGFIGSHLVRRLAAEGRQVRVLCRESSNLDAFPAGGVDLAIGDVGDLEAVRRAMEGIEVVYHLAATTSGDWATYRQGTVIGTGNVLQAAAEAGVKKVIYVSSLGVLDASHFPEGGVVDESFPLERHPEARGDYSRAKLEAEQISRSFRQNGKLSLGIVRPGLVYGPGRAEFLSDAGFQVSNGVVLVVGLGGRRLGLTYVENLVDALLRVEQSEYPPGKIYHVVDAFQPSVRQYIRAYRNATGHSLTALYLPTLLWTTGFALLDLTMRLLRGSSPNLGYRLSSIAHGPRYDIRAAREELKWTPRVPFEEGMRKTYGEA